MPGPAHALLPTLRMLALAWLLLLGACATVPADERMLAPTPDGAVAASAQPCAQPAQPATIGPDQALDPKRLRLVSWNLHKGEDDGWQADLDRFARSHDLVLLQEAMMTAPLRSVLSQAGLSWRMAGAFAMGDQERGVLTAARVSPLTACTLRSFEPLFPLPKSALVARYRLADHDKPLAVANLHGINFSLGLGRFIEQLEAVAAELARHDGPIIFAGDFNTWSQARHETLHDLATRLGMAAVDLVPDGRRRTFGRHLDHLYIRGLTVIDAHAPEVKSSDHNPLLVTLQLH